MTRRRLLAAASLALPAGPALADVPFLTDDPFLIDPGHYEVALGFDRLDLPAADATFSGASFDVGIGDGAQVGVAAPARHSGGFTVGEVAANAKFALVPARAGRFAIAARPAMAIPLDNAIRSDVGVFLPLYGGLTSGKWSLYGGGGYALNSLRDGENYSFGGLVASRSLGERWAIGAELDGRGANDVAPGFVELGAGASLAVGRDFTLAAAIHRTLAQRGANGDGRAFLTLRYAR